MTAWLVKWLRDEGASFMGAARKMLPPSRNFAFFAPWRFIFGCCLKTLSPPSEHCQKHSL